MIREKFTSLVNSIPNLVDSGIATRSFCRQHKLEYPQSNSLLLSDEGFSAFLRCVEWLQKNCIPNKTVTSAAPSSRTLQQIAKKGDYVSNGAMIAAIIYQGFPYKIQDDSPNVLVGVSRKSPCFSDK
jgi:hypothetical protein